MWRPWNPRPSSPQPGPSRGTQPSNLERVSSPQPGPSHIPTPAKLQRVDEDGNNTSFKTFKLFLWTKIFILKIN